MATLLEIFNTALLRAGVQPLVSVEDDSKIRRDCELFYKERRRGLLRQYRWRFAIRRVQLAPVEGAPAFGFARLMRLPADCVTVIAASPDFESGRELLTDAPATYRVEGDNLLTDYDAMYVLYVADVTNTTEFDPLFVETLSFFMAGDLSFSISNDREQASTCYAEARESLRRARLAGAIEQPAEIPDTYGLIDSRGRMGLAMRAGRVLGPVRYTPEAEPR